MMVRRLGRPALALVEPAALLGLVAIVALVPMAACSSSGVGIGVCRQVEEALCRQAGACNIPLTTPNFTSGSAVDACIEYYDDQCFHGLVVGNNPPAASVNACIAAIQKSCSFPVTSPQSSPDCAWLNPADAAVEASEELDAGSTDATDAATGG